MISAGVRAARGWSRWPSRRPRTWSAGRSATPVAPHVVHQRGHQPGPGAAERVAERDRAAARVQPRLGSAPVSAQPGAEHRGERLVDLERADVGDRQPGPRQHLLRWPGSAPVSMMTGSTPATRDGVHPGQRRASPSSAALSRGGDQQRGGPVGDLRGVAGGDHAVLAERRASARPASRAVLPRPDALVGASPAPSACAPARSRRRTAPASLRPRRPAACERSANSSSVVAGEPPPLGDHLGARRPG